MKQIRHSISILLSVLMIIGLFAVAPIEADAAISTPYYIDTNGNRIDVSDNNKYQYLTDTTTTLNSGKYYLLDSDVEISSRITCSGDANLILTDGFTLTALNGISVNSGNSLTIYGQEQGTGKLSANNIIENYNEFNATIGSDRNNNSGTITINGGQVESKGSAYAAAIGGAYYQKGTVVINGGVVTAKNSYTTEYDEDSYEQYTGGVCIGGGIRGEADVTINGGVVTAIVDEAGTGLGSGWSYNNGSVKADIKINGGKIVTPSIYGNSDSTIAIDFSDCNSYLSVGSCSKTVVFNCDVTDGTNVYPTNTSGVEQSISGKTLYKDPKTWSQLNSLLGIINGNVKLACDFTAEAADSALTIAQDKNITLDLNGHTLNRALTQEKENGNAITNNGILTINDTSADGNGTITGAFNQGRGGAIVNNGTLKIQNGIISGNKAKEGGAVANLNSGSLTVSGGTITQNETFQYGGGGIVNLGGTVTISGGTICKNVSAMNGGGIWSNGTLNISGGTITENVAGNGQNGGGISYSGGSLELSGSPVITDNTAQSGGKNDLYIWNTEQENLPVLVTGTLKNSAKIGVRLNSMHFNAFTSGLSGKGTYSNFVSNFDDADIRTDASGEACFTSYKHLTVNKPENGSVRATNNANGNYAVSGEILNVCEGDEITLTFTPDYGYYTKAALVDGVEKALENGKYTFTMTGNDAAVSAEFEKNLWFTGHGLTLSGDVGLNFFLFLTDEEISKGTVVDFTWNVDGTKKTHSVQLSADDKAGDYYKASVPLAAAEMTYDVTATLTIGGSETESNVYSVKKYATDVLSEDYKTLYINNGHSQFDYKKLESLVIAMLDYGAKAQMQFNRNIFNLANKGIGYETPELRAEDITSRSSDMTSGLENYGLSYEGSTIVYLTKCSIRHYYSITDQSKFDQIKDSITFDGKPTEFVEKGGLIYFELTNVAADDFDEPFVLNIGSSTYGYSVIDYVRECLSAPNVTYTTMQLVSATYWYWKAAENYIGN